MRVPSVPKQRNPNLARGNVSHGTHRDLTNGVVCVVAATGTHWRRASLDILIHFRNSDTIAVFRQPKYVQARAEAMVFFRRLFPRSGPLSAHLHPGAAGPRATP